jgi:hypothetical protein
LRGEEVTLYADVNKASHDALKFKQLFLLVEANNSTSDNKTLNELLEHFWVRLVYSGKSEFRLKGEKMFYSTIEKKNLYKLIHRYKKKFIAT